MGHSGSARFSAAPATLVRSSFGVGWQGLHVGRYLLKPVATPFLLRPSDGLDLLLVTDGSCMVGRFDAAKPSWAHAIAGSTTVTLRGRPDLLRWRATAPNPVRVVSVSIHRTLLGELDASFTGPDRLRRFDRVSVRDRALAQRIGRLEDVMLQGGARPHALAAVDGVLQHLVDRDHPEPHEAVAPDEWRPDEMLQRVIRHVFAHVEDPLTVDDLARIAHLSRFHFIRVFQRDVGLTPHRFVSLVRMRCAGDLLLGTDLPVAAVAASAGWSSRSQFSNAFLTAYGESPTGFRKRFAQPAGDPVLS